jgi:GxxExxY protein
MNNITETIIKCAFKVHSKLGPGLLEKAYEICLAHELKKTGMKVDSQVSMPVKYDNINIDIGYRLDLLVEDKVIVELKSVEDVTDVHKAQLLSYLKLGEKNIGLLINFNVKHLKKGITRMVNNYSE